MSGLRRGHAVGEVGVGIAGHVGKIALAHAHLHPHLALIPGPLHPHCLDVLHQVGVGALVEVVVVAQLLQFGIDPSGVFVAPVRQHHYVVAVIAKRITFFRFDDDGAVEAGLFLKSGVTVIPVGATLSDLEPVGKGFSRSDAFEVVGDVRHPVHGAWQDNAVPMDGCALGQFVSHAQGDGVTLFPAQQGRWQ